LRIDRRLIGKLLCISVLAVLAATLASWVAAVLLSRSAPAAIGEPPADLHARVVVFPSASGASLHGWYVEGASGRGAVVLMHGVRANRLAMLDRAHFLAADGYSVLLFDFQAHGESQGAHITFGYLESLDAFAALSWLHGVLPGERVGVLGVSMGGAATLMAEPSLDADAFVIEQVYPEIVGALDNRLHTYLGRAGGMVEPLLLDAMAWHLDLDPARLRPIDHIAGLHAPLLLIAGSADRHTTLEQSRALFAAAVEPKELWIVDGAAHIDLDVFSAVAYRARILAFFGKTLRPKPDQPTARSMPSIATSTMRSISPSVMQ
jgi:fermentation-respiration switch protein FrsA (DUF1100 family)